MIEVQRSTHPWWEDEFPETHWSIFEDFRVFLALVWRHLSLPEPTAVQYDIAYHLQHGPRRLVIQAYRGVGKSWITSAFVLWLLLRDPQLKILVVSASKERADQFSTFTLRLIFEMPLLSRLIPRHDQRQSKIAFDVGPATADHAPSVKSIGVMGQMAGSRANIIIPDDVEVPNNSETQGMRDKLSERVKEFDAILKPGGRVLYLGTPQCEDSLYKELPTRGYMVRIWPARYPFPQSAEKVYGDWLAPKIQDTLDAYPHFAGRPVDPQRFNDEDLLEREASYGRSGFALQFMLDTRLSDADRYPLRLSDLIVMGTNKEMFPEKLIWSGDPTTVIQDLDCVGLNGDRYREPAAVMGSWVPYTGSVMFVDPSGRGKDETGVAVVKMLNGYLVVRRVEGLRGGYSDDVMVTIATMAKDEGVNRILIESNFGDGMFTALLKPHLLRIYPCTTEEVRHNRQKELRIIDTLEPIMNQHRLVVDRAVVERDLTSTRDYPPEKAMRMQLFYQMSRITKDKGALAHDDRLDALAGACAYWVEQMGQDEERHMKSRRDELLHASLADHNDQPLLSIDRLALGMSLEQARNAGSGGKGRSFFSTPHSQ